ncbi:MAG: inorganic phosphate transporter [Marinilabiliales bacterium]
MESLYLAIVVILCLLAVSDLIVGVSNDAVNFLNSAVGAKAAPFRIILLIAALGIIVGATFSSGMMEVARKGIFHPEHFYFNEIMVIFLAVMITDVILLDLFNTFGLPTSTTVSIVFELLGAALAVSIYKIASNPDALGLADYINTGKALAIIGGILFSVIIAFIFGAIIQYLSRLLFSFNFKKRIKYFGALWGSLAITAITYFILIKGAKGASFMTDDMLKYLSENTFKILVLSFLSWAVILQLLLWIFKLDIFKMIVLVGTFALAMAFAGNDMVNFIGVPIAGLDSYKAYISQTNGISPDAFSMEMLSGKVKTDTYILLIAGLIMVATLWLSRKAKTVIRTSLNLSRQSEGYEKFGSSLIARSIVRGSRNLNNGINKIIPKGVKTFIQKQFDQTPYINEVKNMPDPPSFDMIRASVNLFIASVLISIGTALKLPLSTTYVTFMVAMGSSLADKAWGKESAVYRITGVIVVIAGWFFTAISAMTISFIVAILLIWGGLFTLIPLIVFVAFMVYRTHKIHRKKEAVLESEVEENNELLYVPDIVEKCSLNVNDILKQVKSVYEATITAMVNEDRKTLKEMTKIVKSINDNTKKLKDKIPQTIQKLQQDSIESGPYYIQVLDYLRETAHCLTYIANPCFQYVDNNHTGFIEAQKQDLIDVKNDVLILVDKMNDFITTKNFELIDEILDLQSKLLTKVESYRKNQIKRIKTNEVGTKNSMLYLGIFHETKNMILHSINLIKSYRDFVKFLD